SSKFRVAGKDACAHSRASIPEVVAICCDMRFTVIVVKTKEATTRAPLPMKTAARMISDRDWSRAPSVRQRGGSGRASGSSLTPPRGGAGPLDPAEVRRGRGGNAHAARLGLMVLEERREGARQRHPRGVQRVRNLGLGARLAAKAHAHPPRLE